ncbi:DNA-binding transcriptional regulator, AcrR family [Amycolatopsis tolypomycina]|uniref:DNA-binding transcriptional regulator, AcrR family n=1 Tax=Amycolatopsis tolypomycina TaxID=208445 RepID=A0A1H4P2S3_9PSEU|nr:TetR family transcriptional regulator [Amycolatopsis tolypomycina]SEC01614.1 DNA-binding transcriptional regulator, AcrR family [Amycolatopsis tolypomycina]
MTDEPGLRERKKLRTRAAISTAAIELFLERGFDAVGVAEVARVAEVSKRTLFAYFPTKEDLVLHRFADHETDAADVVRARRPDQGPLAALREAFLRGLEEREPVTGLCDLPAVVAVFRLVTGTPALAARLAEFTSAGEVALAAALAEAGVGAPDASLAAAQIAAVRRTLAGANMAAVAAGVPADRRLPAAVAAAERAFTLLSSGVGFA